MTNRAILTQVANRTKSATAAADYLADVKAKHPHALALQCIPEDPQLWQLDKYEDFLATRRKMLAVAFNEYLEGITATAEIAPPASLQDMIAEGESDGLEFKSSLRWDYEKGQPNKKLEEVIVKSVAAFGNSAGGTLLIGVEDTGAILGLENDYAALEADRDRFEVHVRNVLSHQLGVNFVASRLTIEFPTVSEVEICQIDIDPAAEPLIVKRKDANGHDVEKFYVRSGNTSQELPMGEMPAYLAEHFK